MISVVVPVSPIPSHPETDVLEETISSIRFHLPDSEIWLTFDGVREEQAERLEAYEEHIGRVLWLAKRWGAVVPWIFEKHTHQSGMLRKILPDIETPLLLYVEADTPLVTDEPIDWDSIVEFIELGEANLVRLHHEAVIPEEHKSMMHGTHGWHDNETDFILTSQWSQRPHVASTAYYQRILDSHFSIEAKSFIEDRMYGVVETAYREYGMHGWNQHRLHIYDPGGGNMKRSYHTDGRAGAAKYDETQVW